MSADRPGYTGRLVALAALGLVPRGRVTVAEVAHDADCPAMRGRTCRCRPEITLREVQPDGTIGGGARAG